MPLPFFQKPLASEQHATAMRVLGSDAVLKPSALQCCVQRFDESDDFGVKGDVLHGEPGAGGRGRAAVGDALDFDKTGKAALDEGGVALGFVVDVEALDEGEAEDGAHAEALFAEDVEAAEESLPEVAVEGPVDFA